MFFRLYAIALLLLPSLAFAQQPTPTEQALQATVLDQVQALVNAHTAEASLRAQVADLQKQIADAKAPKETPKP